jgi:hypothetical protein
MLAMPEAAPRPLNACRLCGSRSYARVIERACDGVLRPTGAYRCAGCRLAFTDPRDWRKAGASAPGHAAAASQA